MFVFKFKI